MLRVTNYQKNLIVTKIKRAFFEKMSYLRRLQKSDKEEDDGYDRLYRTSKMPENEIREERERRKKERELRRQTQREEKWRKR